MLTPSVSESRINSCRRSSHCWPVRVRKSIARSHSSSVGSMSRMKACRWWIRLDITSFRRGSGVPAILCNTLAVIPGSAFSLMRALLPVTVISSLVSNDRRPRLPYTATAQSQWWGSRVGAVHVASRPCSCRCVAPALAGGIAWPGDEAEAERFGDMRIALVGQLTVGPGVEQQGVTVVVIEIFDLADKERVVARRVDIDHARTGGQPRRAAVESHPPR